MYSEAVKNRIVTMVEELRQTMSLERAILKALESTPGPSLRTVRGWVNRPPRKPRPKTEYFNPLKQAAVDRVWELVETKGMSRLAACREVFPTIPTWAWGHKKPSIRRLYRWCDGPQGDRFTMAKLDYLKPMQLYDYEQYREMGYGPREAYNAARRSCGPGATG